MPRKLVAGSARRQPRSASRARIYDRFGEWFAAHPDAPQLVAEHRFAAPARQWRFDFAHLPSRVAIELEGGTWIGGRHNRGSGYERDCEKYNVAAQLGWRLIRLTPGMLERDPERWRQAILDAIAEGPRA